MSFTVEIGGLPELKRVLTPELYTDAMVKLVADGAVIAQREAREQASTDTGALARSIASEAHGFSSRVYSTASYAGAVESGRRAGAGMPPPDALRGWMQRHGLGGVSPYVIARGIARRGVRGRFFMAKAARKLEQQLPELGRKALEDIGRRWEK